MKTKKKVNQRYSSFEEYKKKLYPNSSSNEAKFKKSDNPVNLGIVMARETLDKVKHLLLR